ncbi:D-2-hydroxyacid dehydrogenase family protein [Ramlibacter sp.]|uniref:D-2-hydroxyacid dehydrogenase family protein n=1 Tax=Ramlibacter sp. TaxID=1917967 RepID=UPI003D0ACEED
MNESLRIAILDDYQQVALRYGPWERLSGRAELTVFSDNLADEDALAERLRPFDVVCLMRERTRITDSLLARLPRLKLIVTSAMVNAAVDIPAVQRRGIVMCGTSAEHTGTPELTWMHILALARNLPAEQENLQRGGWQAAVGRDLYGSTLGVLGLGRVGSRVARVGAAFGMRVIAWSPRLTPERAAEHEAECVTKEELFRRADFVTVSMKFRPSTVGLVGADEIALMKPTAYLINTARATIVDEDALLAALRSGRIAGAGIDVFDPEPLRSDHPFRALPNVLITPHIGYVTDATYRGFYTDTVEDIEAWLAGQPIRLVQPPTD